MASNESINYEAVLADLEARKAHLESAIAAIRGILGQGGTGPNPLGTAPQGTYAPAHDAYLGLSIPDAAKKHLSVTRKPHSTQDLLQGLIAGGLPSTLKYSTIYGVLSRRSKQVGDIVNMKGDWALAEWYQGFKVGGKSSKSNDSSDKENSTESEQQEKKEVKSA